MRKVLVCLIAILIVSNYVYAEDVNSDFNAAVQSQVMSAQVVMATVEPPAPMEIGDTFEDGDYTNNPTWQVQSNGPIPYVSTAAAKDGSYGLRSEFFPGCNDRHAGLYKTNIGNLSKINAWTNVRTSNYQAQYQVAKFGIGVTSMFIMYGRFVAYHGNTQFNFDTIPENDTWYRFRIEFDQSQDSADKRCCGC